MNLKLTAGAAAFAFLSSHVRSWSDLLDLLFVCVTCIILGMIFEAVGLLLILLFPVVAIGLVELLR